MSQTDLKRFQDAMIARKHYDIAIRGVLGGPLPEGVCEFIVFLRVGFLFLEVSSFLVTSFYCLCSSVSGSSPW